MIQARIYKAKTGSIYGFSIESHGNDIVCAAVSILAQNTINSIERFTEDHFVCEYVESGGYMHFEHTSLKNGQAAHDASLLLESMAYGLYGIKDEYNTEIKITEEVEHD